MNKQKLVFATNNAHKLKEVSMMLGEDIELLSLCDIGCTADIPETANTFEGNALQKAEYIYEQYGLDCFADDSGLEVDALQGAPGVFSARYAALPLETHPQADAPPASAGHDSEANTQRLLRDLEKQANRNAQFRTVTALILKGEKYLFEGTIRGEITKEKRGTNGFGYDPVFIPEGFYETFAELPASVKNKISHRAVSIKKLCEFLTTLGKEEGSEK